MLAVLRGMATLVSFPQRRRLVTGSNAHFATEHYLGSRSGAQRQYPRAAVFDRRQQFQACIECLHQHGQAHDMQVSIQLRHKKTDQTRPNKKLPNLTLKIDAQYMGIIVCGPPRGPPRRGSVSGRVARLLSRLTATRRAGIAQHLTKQRPHLFNGHALTPHLLLLRGLDVSRTKSCIAPTSCSQSNEIRLMRQIGSARKTCPKSR